jgi:hypothetical protein
MKLEVESLKLQIYIQYLQLTAVGSCFFLQNMIPRFKKIQKVINQRLNKEEFLEEHNKLSPVDLQATTALLSRFRIDKESLFKNDDWSIDKLRRPFILWLTSLPSRNGKRDIEKKKTC